MRGLLRKINYDCYIGESLMYKVVCILKRKNGSYYGVRIYNGVVFTNITADSLRSGRNTIEFENAVITKEGYVIGKNCDLDVRVLKDMDDYINFKLDVPELSSYENELRDLKADIFGECFVLSMKEGYDSEYFINTVMTSRKLECAGDLIYDDERQEWSCGIELLHNIVRRESLVKSSNLYDEYMLWFMGYLYKYWMRTTKERPAEILEQLPVRNFYKSFGHYHTQGWLYIIRDAKKMYGMGKW